MYGGNIDITEPDKADQKCVQLYECARDWNSLPRMVSELTKPLIKVY